MNLHNRRSQSPAAVRRGPAQHAAPQPAAIAGYGYHAIPQDLPSNVRAHVGQNNSSQAHRHAAFNQGGGYATSSPSQVRPPVSVSSIMDMMAMTEPQPFVGVHTGAPGMLGGRSNQVAPYNGTGNSQYARTPADPYEGPCTCACPACFVGRSCDESECICSSKKYKSQTWEAMSCFNCCAVLFHLVLFLVAIIGTNLPNANKPMFLLKYDQMHVTVAPMKETQQMGIIEGIIALLKPANATNMSQYDIDKFRAAMGGIKHIGDSV
jgi:hypothetical protein